MGATVPPSTASGLQPVALFARPGPPGCASPGLEGASPDPGPHRDGHPSCPVGLLSGRGGVGGGGLPSALPKLWAVVTVCGYG